MEMQSNGVNPATSVVGNDSEGVGNDSEVVGNDSEGECCEVVWPCAEKGRW